MNFKFPELTYSYDALEPYIDAKTMELHYSKHHKGYYEKFLAAVEGTPRAEQTLEQIFAEISDAPAAVRNNGGGYYNHCIFWESMAPNAGGTPTGNVAKAINDQWGDFENFKTEFAKAATTVFGSGFTWLVKEGSNLKIIQTKNQDNPLMDVVDGSGTPIMALDVWEHAYYIHYQNRRPEYIESWWNVVNWTEVENKYNA